MRLIQRLGDIDSLPTLPDQQTITDAVSDILELATHSDVSRQAVAEALYEMLDRQVSLFQPFPPGTGQQIEAWLISVWSEQPHELFEYLAGLASNIGHPRSLALLKRALESSNDSVVRELARQALT